MGKYLDALKDRNITAYLLGSKQVLTMNIPDGTPEDLMAKIRKAAPKIKAELLALELDQTNPNSSDARESTPLMQAIRHRRKLATCKACGEPVEAIEYEQPSEGYHHYECLVCEYVGVVCLSEQSDQATQMQSALDTKGYCLIRSSVLKEVVVITKSDSIPLPKELRKLVSYTLGECSLIAKDTLPQTHRIKKQFNGKIEKAEGVLF